MTLKKELAELQDKLAVADLSMRPSAPRGLVTFSVKELKEIQIRMEGNKNHKRPHVHVDYGKQHHVASYAIDTGDRLVGDLDPRYDRHVRAWIEGHRSKLLLVWALTQAGEKSKPFVCGLLKE